MTTVKRVARLLSWKDRALVALFIAIGLIGLRLSLPGAVCLQFNRTIVSDLSITLHIASIGFVAYAIVAVIRAFRRTKP